jgi:hypothetical protein
MSNELVAAAQRLGDMLAAENSALAALDFAKATSLLADKTRAIDAFVAAQALTRGGMPLGISKTDAQALSDRLATLAEENKRLLAHALQVQKRVIRVIADAIPPPEQQQGGRYGNRGALAYGRKQPAYALSARA